MTKRVLCFVLAFLFLAGLSGCGKRIDMPFNGDVAFHQLSLTIPERFIRDSTQSNADRWIFEHGNYAEYVILVRSDIGDDSASSFLESYQSSMSEIGDSEVIEFHGKSAVHSCYVKDGVACEEIFFAYHDSFYAVALRGGTEADFQQLIGTISLVAPAE